MKNSKSKKFVRKKMRFSKYQKKNQPSISLLVSIGSYKRQIKNLQKNNRCLAKGLETVQGESASYLKIVQEYSEENAKIIHARTKLKVMAETIQVLVTELSEVMSILNVKPLQFMKKFQSKNLRCPVSVPDVEPIEEMDSIFDNSHFSEARSIVSPTKPPVSETVLGCKNVRPSHRQSLSKSQHSPALPKASKRALPNSSSLPSPIQLPTNSENLASSDISVDDFSSIQAAPEKDMGRISTLSSTPSPPILTSNKFFKNFCPGRGKPQDSPPVTTGTRVKPLHQGRWSVPKKSRREKPFSPNASSFQPIVSPHKIVTDINNPEPEKVLNKTILIPTDMELTEVIPNSMLSIFPVQVINRKTTEKSTDCSSAVVSAPEKTVSIEAESGISSLSSNYCKEETQNGIEPSVSAEESSPAPRRKRSSKKSFVFKKPLPRKDPAKVELRQKVSVKMALEVTQECCSAFESMDFEAKQRQVMPEGKKPKMARLRQVKSAPEKDKNLSKKVIEKKIMPPNSKSSSESQKRRCMEEKENVVTGEHDLSEPLSGSVGKNILEKNKISTCEESAASVTNRKKVRANPVLPHLEYLSITKKSAFDSVTDQQTVDESRSVVHSDLNSPKEMSSDQTEVYDISSLIYQVDRGTANNHTKISNDVNKLVDVSTVNKKTLSNEHLVSLSSATDDQTEVYSLTSLIALQSNSSVTGKQMVDENKNAVHDLNSHKEMSSEQTEVYDISNLIYQVNKGIDNNHTKQRNHKALKTNCADIYRSNLKKGTCLELKNCESNKNPLAEKFNFNESDTNINSTDTDITEVFNLTKLINLQSKGEVSGKNSNHNKDSSTDSSVKFKSKILKNQTKILNSISSDSDSTEVYNLASLIAPICAGAHVSKSDSITGKNLNVNHNSLQITTPDNVYLNNATENNLSKDLFEELASNEESESKHTEHDIIKTTEKLKHDFTSCNRENNLEQRKSSRRKTQNLAAFKSDEDDPVLNIQNRKKSTYRVQNIKTTAPRSSVSNMENPKLRKSNRLLNKAESTRSHSPLHSIENVNCNRRKTSLDKEFLDNLSLVQDLPVENEVMLARTRPKSKKITKGVPKKDSVDVSIRNVQSAGELLSPTSKDSLEGGRSRRVRPYKSLKEPSLHKKMRR